MCVLYILCVYILCVPRQLREMLRALSTALPLIGDLHSPAMRPRHWQQLGVATGRAVVADERLTLGAMLQLQLHMCVQPVRLCMHVDMCRFTGTLTR